MFWKTKQKRPKFRMPFLIDWVNSFRKLFTTTRARKARVLGTARRTKRSARLPDCASIITFNSLAKTSHKNWLTNGTALSCGQDMVMAIRAPFKNSRLFSPKYKTSSSRTDLRKTSLRKLSRTKNCPKLYSLEISTHLLRESKKLTNFRATQALRSSLRLATAC